MQTITEGCKGYMDVTSITSANGRRRAEFEFTQEMDGHSIPSRVGYLDLTPEQEFKAGDVLEVECSLGFLRYHGGEMLASLGVKLLNPDPVANPDVIRMSWQTLSDYIEQRRADNGDGSHVVVVLIGEDVVNAYDAGANLNTERTNEYVNEYIFDNAEKANAFVASGSAHYGVDHNRYITDVNEVARIIDMFKVTPQASMRP